MAKWRSDTDGKMEILDTVGIGYLSRYQQKTTQEDIAHMVVRSLSMREVFDRYPISPFCHFLTQ